MEREYERSPASILLAKKHKIIGIGRYSGKIIRQGRIIHEWEDENLVVNEGLNDLLNTYFNNGSQISSWFLGVFQGNYTPVATDTAATIASNSTECSSYTNATRPAWTNAAPSAQAITNSGSPATFTFNASQTIYGAFLISNSAIGGTGGKLFSAAQFGTSKSVVSTDQLLLTYSFSASSS